VNQFRLTLPLDFGDGTVHQPGAIVELDAPTAKLYAHALIRVTAPLPKENVVTPGTSSPQRKAE